MSDTFRREYRALTEHQINFMQVFKQKAAELENEFIHAGNAKAILTVDARCMALAVTNLEQAIMWAVKSIT